MADRVHPSPLLPLSSAPTSPPAADNATETAPLRPAALNRPAPPAPAPGKSYIVQVPKDQVLRVPPPDRARRYKQLASRPARRRLLRRACCGACCVLLALLVLAAAFVGAVYLVLRPKAPSFSVASLSVVRGLGLDTSSSTSSAAVQLDAAVRADNTANKKVGVDYRPGGEVTVSYYGVRLAAGQWPAFYQAPRNVTVLSLTLTGAGVRLTDEQRRGLAAEQASGAVPLAVDARVPVRVRLGKVLRTWTVDVWARCEVTVDSLAAGDDATAAKNKNVRGCRVKVRPLWWWW